MGGVWKNPVPHADVLVYNEVLGFSIGLYGIKDQMQ
jgi:hypothetical protein